MRSTDAGSAAGPALKLNTRVMKTPDRERLDGGGQRSAA